jgi:hypothetical protein
MVLGRTRRSADARRSVPRDDPSAVAARGDACLQTITEGRASVPRLQDPVRLAPALSQSSRQTICGPVSCSFLTLASKMELGDRIPGAGERTADGAWWPAVGAARRHGRPAADPPSNRRPLFPCRHGFQFLRHTLLRSPPTPCMLSGSSRVKSAGVMPSVCDWAGVDEAQLLSKRRC